MGNVNVNAAKTDSDSRKKTKKKKAPDQRSYRKSIRRSKRARVTSAVVDMRDIKTSRGSVRPRVLPGTLWEDPCFPREMAMENSRMEGMDYRWMRPKEFCVRPTLVDRRPSRHDVLQGMIGNCWMMATLAGVADNLPHLLQIIGGVDYDPQSSDYDGTFHCRFWHYGQWVSIYVDDCLPVQRNHGAPRGFSLLGAHSPDPDVLWVALVEKALAKFHGSYKSIEAREREYGWRLLTGGVPYIIEQARLRQTPSDALYERIKDALGADLVVTCSHQNPSGRLHAYTVTGAAHHSTKGNIIRVRNPWGEEKGRISWLETPERWPYAADEDADDFVCRDGEFWVMRGECYREFNQFCIGCFKGNYYDSATKESTILEHKYSCYGEWRGDSAGGNQLTDVFRNPKYKIKIFGNRNKKKKILFELIPRPVDRNKGVCMFIYKITRLRSTFKATLCQNLLSDREAPTFLANGCPQFSYSLCPGVYMVVPVAQSSADEREYCLRVYSTTRIQCTELKGKFFHLPSTPATMNGHVTTAATNSTTAATEADNFHHYPGLWKNDVFVNEETFTAKLDKLAQFHIKTEAEAKITIRLCQEFLTREDTLKVLVYKVEQPLSKVLDKSFYDEHRPRPALTPTLAKAPYYSETCTVHPACTYVLVVCAWRSTEDRHYVLSLDWPKDAKVTVQHYVLSLDWPKDAKVTVQSYNVS